MSPSTRTIGRDFEVLGFANGAGSGDDMVTAFQQRPELCPGRCAARGAGDDGGLIGFIFCVHTRVDSDIDVAAGGFGIGADLVRGVDEGLVPASRSMPGRLDVEAGLERVIRSSRRCIKVHLRHPRPVFRRGALLSLLGGEKFYFALVKQADQPTGNNCSGLVPLPGARRGTESFHVEAAIGSAGCAVSAAAGRVSFGEMHSTFFGGWVLDLFGVFRL